MRYTIKQKALSLGQKFSVKDEQGRDVFFVQGPALRIKDQLTISDLMGNEVCRIEQKLLAGTLTFLIFRHGDKRATIKKALVSLKPKFRVNFSSGDDWLVTGKLTQHEFQVQSGPSAIATVTKKWVAVADTYGIDVASGVDDLDVLAVALAMDLMMNART